MDWGSGHYGIGITGDESEWVVVSLWESGELAFNEAQYPWEPDRPGEVTVDRLSADASSHYSFPADPEERERITASTGVQRLAGVQGEQL